MKLNLIALTALSCIGFGLFSPLSTQAIPARSHQEATVKGGQGHHDHSPAHSDEMAPTDTAASEATDLPNAEMHDADMSDATESSSHERPSEGHAEGGSHNGGHHGGPHNGGHHGSHDGRHHSGHGGTMASAPWFHHGAIEVSDVFQLSMANADKTVLEMSEMMMPSVMVMIHPDAVNGWNIEVQTEHFTFSGEQVNQANQPNIGHGHLYVNGEKVARLYGNWFYLEHLESGSNDITVSLHANGHEVWTHEGDAIAHTTTVEVP